MKKITSIFLIAILYGCGSSVSPVDQGLIDQVMHIGNGSEPQGLDPHIVTGVPEHHLLITMCEGLTISNPEGGANLPGMAESWDISEDGRTYIFNIRKDAKWSNGDDFTAEDIVWSWMRVLTPSLGSQYPDMLYYLVGAEDFNTGVITDFSEVGVKALDNKTLEVNLINPTPFFLGLLSHYSTRPGNFVCNGPMNLKSWELNKKIIVEKNPLYWDAEKVRLNEMHFYPVSDINTEERMFRAGQLHLTGTVPSQKCGIWREEGNPNLRIDPYMGTYYYRANVNVKPLDNIKVRKALTYAIDRQKLTEKVTQCGQIPAFSFTPPGAAGYNPETEIPYDPELARQLLAEAGYESTEDFPVLQILYNTSEDHRKIALTIQQMWQQNLGISVELENMDWKVYLSRQNSMDYQISRAGWIGDYEDPNTFLDIMRTGRGNNRTGWSNPEFDELVGRANATTNQEERYRLLGEAEKILIDELPIIPIYTYVRSYQLSPDVKGYFPNYLDHHHPKTLYLERD